MDNSDKDDNFEFSSVRREIIKSIFEARSSENFKKKQMVKSLFAEIAAAKESGIDFQEISNIMERAGVMISHHTLRAYYFQIKQDKEITAITDKPIATIKHLAGRNSIERINSGAIASVKIAKAITAGKIEPKEEVASKAIQSDRQKKSEKPPILPKQKIQEINEARPLAEHFEGLPVNHLSAIAARSKNLADFPTLETDLILLDDDCVYEEGSNMKFTGCLSQRQISMIKNIKKLIAPKKSRTGTDFVKMKTKL